jgi:pimeloyl-ACP methyl ester carboxylesterase
MRRFTAFAGALLVLAACTQQETTIAGLAGARGNPLDATGNVVSETSNDLWARIITGETGPGSQYQLYLPREWNGTAVFYAHGIRDVLEPVSLRNQDNLQAIRDELGRRGFAVAYSSFDENGYAEKDGAQRTHQLRGLFTSVFGAPARSLLVGHSLGGLIVMDLAERFADEYDGVAALCGVVGGTQAEFDHMVTTRMLFDLFYPGIMPGTYNDPPPGFLMTPQLQGQIIAAITANPLGLAAIGSVSQASLQFNLFASPSDRQTQMVTSLITALTFHGRGADNVLPLTNGKFPFDNREAVYTSAAIPLLSNPTLGSVIASINANAPRMSGEPAALNYTDRNFTPSGALRIPTLTLHNHWDPLVPYFHEGLLRDRVNGAGAGGLLVQRTKDAYGHCNFTVAEQVTAITDLAQWVETGIKPNN